MYFTWNMISMSSVLPLCFPLGGPWAPFGRLGTPLGSLWAVIWNLLTILSEQRGRYHCACAQEQALPRFSQPEGSRQSRGSRQRGVRNRCSDPTSTRAGGQDDVRVKQTPSNYTNLQLFMRILCERRLIAQWLQVNVVHEAKYRRFCRQSPAIYMHIYIYIYIYIYES